MTFIDFCSGIGGFRLGLELAGYKCIGFCEKDKYAVKSYRAMFDTQGEWYADDVTKLKPEEIPYADIWTFGFPCQDISVAGKQRGLSGERSGIYFSIIDLIKGKEEKDKPTYLLIENVKNLLSINGGFDFTQVLTELDQAGYDAMWQVLNSKDFGVPQNRERVFIIANLRSRGRREILPIGGENAAALKQIIGGMQGYRVYDADGISATLVGNARGVGAKTGLYFIDQSNTKTQITGTSRCITSRYTGGIVNRTAMNSAVLEERAVIAPDREDKWQNGRRMKEATKKGYIDTELQMATRDKHYRIRRLTPKECFRLQGFPDELFEKARAVNSDAQLYKQAGNAVTVNVAFAIANRLPEKAFKTCYYCVLE